MKLLKIYSVVISIGLLVVIWMALEYRNSANLFLGKYEFYVDHFGQRNKFLEANQPLKTDTSITNRVVFIGTQVIENWALDNSFPDYEVINRGIKSQIAPEIMLRFYSDVLTLAPQFVIIEISSYNFRPRYSVEELAEATKSMALLAKAGGITPIITTIIPPRQDFKFGPDCVECPSYQIWDSLALYNAEIINFATKEAIPLSDWNKLLANKNGYFADSLAANLIEPNQAGYNLINDDLLRIFNGQ